MLDPVDKAIPRDLCQQCGRLFSSPGLRQLASTKKFRHSTLVSFQDRENCRFCRYLWNEDFTGGRRQPTPFRRLRDLIHPLSDKAKTQSFNKFPSSWVVITGPKLEGSRHRGRVGYLESATSNSRWAAITSMQEGIYIRIENAEGRMLWEFPMLYVVAKEGDPCAALTSFRPLEWDGLTSKSALSLKAIIDTCQTSHTHCQPSTPRALPSRLLYIPSDYSDSLSLRLRVTPPEGQVGQYVALSYCWGGPQSFSLKKDNLNKLQQETIHSTDLPQTLRDAVLVTHYLGYQFLWIDALCIIQDSAEDKSREIKGMRAIYQNAAITIAAATATSVHEGFLEGTGKLSGKYSSCPIPVSLVDEEENRSAQGLISIVPMHMQKTEDFPINKRGWTYQEALVSPRLLVFGDLEPFLRCQTKEATLKTKTCVAYSASMIQPQRFMNKIKSGPEYNIIIEDGAVIDLRLEFLWKDLVEQYTHRELGLQEDRPLAIAGVIDSISDLTSDKCFYGIWKSCAVACLLWKLDSNSGRESLRIPGLPSWSWMSITGAVELDSLVHLKSPEASVEWDENALPEALQISCRVLEEVEVSNISREDRSGILLDWMLDLGEMATIPHWEGRLQPPTSEPLYYLVLGRQIDQSFLALIATSDGGSVYKRCGVAELKSSSKISSKQRQMISLE